MYKQIRKEMMILVNTIKTIQGSRETSLVVTKLQEAQMWAGEYLKASGEGENPYAKKDGKRKTIEDIEPLFDATSDTLAKGILEEGQIATIDMVRTILEKRAKDVLQNSMTKAFDLDMEYEKKIQISVCLNKIHTSMMEAKMWLGMELGRIRDTVK